MPFTTTQFIDVFRQYNVAVWPVQWALTALAVLAALLALRGKNRSGRVAAILLALLWMWMGVAYHLMFFAKINKAAVVFGALFIMEGLMLLQVGGVRRVIFRPHSNLGGAVGLLLMLYALAIYPVIGRAVGHHYPAAPTFGLPCPTTIFTFGLLLWVDGRVPVRLLVIPTLWTLIGSAAAWSMGMVEDYGLLIAGVVSTSLILYRDFTPGRRRIGTRRLIPPSLAPADKARR